MAEAAAAAAAPQTSDTDSDEEVDYNSEEYVRCPVCLDFYTEPKVLPCAHLVCAPCLVNWMHAHTRPSTCPVCRGLIIDNEVCKLPLTATPEEVSADLMTDAAMAALVDGHKQLQPPHICGKCGAEANSFCLDCYRKLCKKCRRKHTKVTNKKFSKASAKREAALAENDGEAAAGASEGVLANLPYVPPRKHKIEMIASLDPKTVSGGKGNLCTVHTIEDNFADYYCVTHSTPVCLRCVEGSHKACELTTMELQTEKCRQTLRECADTLRRREKLLRQEEEKLTQTEQEAQAMADATCQEIDRVMDNIETRLRDAKEKLRRDMEESDSLPPAEKVSHQAELLRTFKEQLHGIMSLDSAVAALHRFEEDSQKHIQAVHERVNELCGPGATAARQRQRVYHHHRAPQHRGHHNHQHQQQQRQQQQQQQPAVRSLVPESALRSVLADLNSTVHEVARDLEQAVLSPSAGNAAAALAALDSDNSDEETTQ